MNKDVDVNSWMAPSDNQDLEIKCVGCSFESYATSCGHIRAMFPFRSNGFYWIKTACMSEPLKVYCDYEFSNGNFYYYKGVLADKSDNVIKDELT